MKTEPWNRSAQVKSIASDIWRYVSAAAVEESDVELEAAALLDMTPTEVRTLARVHFLLSDEVRRLMDEMPRLVRRLTTTTVLEEEMSAERVRGPIQWSPTFGRRAATGLPHLYVTSPARRAFQTPENEALVAALDAVRTVGRRSGWHRSSSEEVGLTVRHRVADADRWLRLRALSEVQRRPITPQTVSQVKRSRARKRYRAALDVIELHRRFIRRRHVEAIRAAIEARAIAPKKDDRILELKAGFLIEAALRKTWDIEVPGLVGGGVFLEGYRNGQHLKVWYQRTPPPELSAGSIYRSVQQVHPFRGIGGMVPDFVFRVQSSIGPPRWILGEVKGVDSPVHDLARNAVKDLLAYRRAFDPVLKKQHSPYGLAIAWGSELTPSVDSEIAICTPDTIKKALSLLLDPQP